MKENWTFKKVKDVCDKASSNIVLNKIEDNNGDYALYGASGFVKGVDFYHQEEPYIGIVKDGSGVGRVGAYPAKSSLVGTMQYILPKKDCSLKFLCYALQGLKLSKFVTGAAIPHIYFRDYGECVIPVPPLSEQSHIVSELDLLQSIIDKQQAQLKELDTLAQAVFYDMFGDPVENEKGWETDNLKTVAPQKQYNGIVPSTNGKFWLLNLDMVEQQTGSIIEKVLCDQNEIGNSTIIFDTTNVLYSKLRPYLNKVVLPDEIGYGTSELVPLKPNTDVLDRVFLAYLLRSKSFVNYISVKVAGAKMPRVSMDILRDFLVIQPPISLQQSFTEKIEAIERQKAIINQSLTETQKLFDYTMDKYFG